MAKKKSEVLGVATVVAGKQSFAIWDGLWGPMAGKRVSRYQRLIANGLPSIRQLLTPDEGDYIGIIDQIDFYRKTVPWVNHGLILRAALNAAEFWVVSPGNSDQSEWMVELLYNLKMFSFIREWFWHLKAHGQVISMWRTQGNGRLPTSVEIPDPKIYQTRFNSLNGANPQIIVVPKEDKKLRAVVDALKSVGGNKTKKAHLLQQVSGYPQVIVDAVRDFQNFDKTEIPVSELEDEGFHFEFSALDKRHYEHWAFPGMYSIFPDLEMIGIFQDADLNAGHHLKVGILLIRLGPQEPRGTDLPVIPTEPQLKAVNAEIEKQIKNKFPTLVTRGDLRLDWVVPPEHVLSVEKYRGAMMRVFDWMGIPKLAWAGQDFSGAFAAGQLTLKFLQQESKDERGVAKESLEDLFYRWSQSSNKFKGAKRPKIRFDPNALVEQRLILDWAKLFMTFGGADLESIAEMADQDVDVWADRRKALKAQYKNLNFDPNFVPRSGGDTGGRPATINQPTPEQGATPQPRPSTAAIERAAQALGIAAGDLERELEQDNA